MLGPVFCLAAVFAAAPLTPMLPVSVPGGAGRFDFMSMDARNGLVFACHPGNRSLAVLDIKAGRALDVPLGVEVNGCAADSARKLVYAAGPGCSLVRVEESGWKKTGSLALEGPGDAVLYRRKDDSVLVANDDGTRLWVVKGAGMKLARTVAIGEGPESMELDSKEGRLYLAVKAASAVQTVDLKEGRVTSEARLDGLTSAHGLCLDRRARRVFVAGKNGRLSELDADSGRVLCTIDIVSGIDQIAYDRGLRRLYIPGKGQMQTVQATGDSLAVIGSIPLAKDCCRAVVDQKTHVVYTAYVEGGQSLFQAFKAQP